jgi:hypothetical protein
MTVPHRPLAGRAVAKPEVIAAHPGADWDQLLRELRGDRVDDHLAAAVGARPRQRDSHHLVDPLGSRRHTVGLGAVGHPRRAAPTAGPRLGPVARERGGLALRGPAGLLQSGL